MVSAVPGTYLYHVVCTIPSCTDILDQLILWCAHLLPLLLHGGKVQSLHLPVVTDEMAGHTTVCLCCTTSTDISCQCVGAFDFFNGPLYLLNTLEVILFNILKGKHPYSVHCISVFDTLLWLFYAWIKIKLLISNLNRISSWILWLYQIQTAILCVCVREWMCVREL